MQKINTETCQKKKKEAKREYGRNRYINMTEDKKNKLKENQKNYQSSIKNINFFAYINTSQETSKFGYVEVNNKQFWAFKNPIALNFVDTRQNSNIWQI